MNKQFAIGAATLAILLIAVLIAPLASIPATAAPPAAVTPVAGVVHSGVRSDVLTFFQTSVITADGCSALINIQDHAKVDMHWKIDQGTTNTTTFSLRWTNTGDVDDVITDATLVSANTADVNAGGQFALFGRQACVYADVTNSNVLTATFIGTGK